MRGAQDLRVGVACLQEGRVALVGWGQGLGLI